MVDQLFSSAVQGALKKDFPGEFSHPNAIELCIIWSEVLEKIVGTTMDNFFKDASPHVDLKPELSVAVANTAYGLAGAIVSARTSGKSLSEIDVDEERRFHSSAKGISAINETTNVATQALQQRYSERWRPKTLAKLEAETNPPTPKPRNPKVVKQNHFISSFFLKSYWAEDGFLTIMIKASEPNWAIDRILTAKWGHEDSLYSHRLEDRFSLIEGDAVGPIKKVIDCYPLNDPERDAFFGYLIVQKMRNPKFRRAIIDGTIPVSVKTVGQEKASDPVFQRNAYETIFENNKLYDEISRPIFWSKWLVVRSNDPVFVLPDTFCIMRKLGERQLLIAPLTPKVCFVATGIPEPSRRPVPFEVRRGALPKLISKCLLMSAENQSACHSGFKIPSHQLDVHRSLSMTVEEIDRILQSFVA